MDRQPLSESRQKLTSELSTLTEKDQKVFHQLVAKAREYAGNGNVKLALETSKKAYKMCPSTKLKKKIERMESYLAENESDEDEEPEEEMKLVGNGFYLYHEMYNKLYKHQKEGVLWLWNLYKKHKGGILGDDMGLGKTIQVIAFLSGMYDSSEVHSCLIVMPVSVIPNWEREFDKWAPGIDVGTFHGSSKKERDRLLYRTQRRGGVLITSYGMVVSSWEQLKDKDGREFVWDYVILDEGHKIKNPTKTSKGVHAIPAKNRIILTGTPIQNNLGELWALYDFVHQGRLLGTRKTFKMEYEGPITRSRERDATSGEKRLGQQMAESLKSIIAPYFLQRTKAQVNKENKENESPDGGSSPQAVMPTLSRKNDLVVWLSLTDTQIKIYSDFLELDSVKELLMTTKSPLVALTVLKKICDHPRLMTTLACQQLGLDSSGTGYDSDDERSRECAANQVKSISVSILLQECGKLGFIVKLLRKLKVEGHRCLIFSQSRKMLDIIQRVLQEEGHKIMRLDGTVKFTSERQDLVQRFQRDTSYNVFLLTSQVGGVGLTLTGADRVIIFDPSWNPATDSQAVDRAFRIGQDKNVVVYRLITCGTVEEKIYRRQIFKDSITKQTTGKTSNPYRYFSKGQLRDLFTLDDPHHSTTQLQLQDLHSNHRKTDPELDNHLAFLYSLDIFGISDHDLMFSQESDDAMGDEEEEGHNNYIESRVQKAKELLTQEANQAAQVDGFSRPMVPDPPKAHRPGATQWTMPSSQPTFEPRRPQNDEDDLVDLGEMDTSQIDDDEINRTLEDLTLEDKDDDSSKHAPKQETVGYSETRGARVIHEVDSPKSHQKNGRASEVILVPDSAENSLVAPDERPESGSSASVDDSLELGESPEAPIAIEDSDDDLPQITRPRSRNRVRIASDVEDYKSPVKVIGGNPDICMESPSPAKMETTVRSPVGGLPTCEVVNEDVMMASPMVADLKSKGTGVIVSDTEDMDVASPMPYRSRGLEIPKSDVRRSLNVSTNDKASRKQTPLLSVKDVEHSPIRTAPKSTTRRRVIESDSEDELFDVEQGNNAGSGDDSLVNGNESTGVEQNQSIDMAESTDSGHVEGDVSGGAEPTPPGRHIAADADNTGEETDIIGRVEDEKTEEQNLFDAEAGNAEEVRDEADGESVEEESKEENLFDAETDETEEMTEEESTEGDEEESNEDNLVDGEADDTEEVRDEEEPEENAKEESKEENHVGAEAGDVDEEVTEEEESGEDEEEESEEESDEEEESEEEEVDENKEKKIKFVAKVKENIAAKEYKKALMYGIQALKIDPSDKRVKDVVRGLRKKCGL